MNTHPSVEKAQSYLAAQWRDSRPAWSNSEGPFVTISRESGSGGSSLARILADQLNQESSGEAPWTVFDGNLIETMLQHHQLDTRLARFLPEDKVSELHASVGELVGLHPSLWQLTQKTNETMRKLARTGRVILVGRGANHATAGVQNGVHVRLVGSAPHRAQSMARLQQLPEAEAAQLNARQDAARERYVRSTFSADVSDPHQYDFVINTERVPLTAAAETIGALVRLRTPLPA